MLTNWAFIEGPSLEVGSLNRTYIYNYSCLCCAAGLVTHSHELVIRNGSSHEKVSGSGLLHCFLFLNALYSGQVAPACRVVPPCLFGTQLNLCTCVCMCVRVIYLLSAQRLYPTKPRPRVNTVCMGHNAPRELAAKPGLVQVL